MKKIVLGLLLAAVALPSFPAIAKQDQNWSDRQRYEDRRSNKNQGRHSVNDDDDRRDHRARNDRRDQRRWDRAWHRRQQQRSAWRDYNRIRWRTA